MNLSTLIQGETWMTPDEQDLNRDLIHDIAAFLAASNVPENALLTLRVNDVAATWLLARRLELALAPAEGEPPPCPTPAQAGAIGKCRDRLRKAMKELEDCCAKSAAPARTGLADQIFQFINSVDATGHVDQGRANDRKAQNAREPQDTRAGTPGAPNPTKSTPRQSAPAATKPRDTAPASPAATNPRATAPVSPAATNPRDTAPASPAATNPGTRHRTTREDARKCKDNQAAKITTRALPPEVFTLPAKNATPSPQPNQHPPHNTS